MDYEKAYKDLRAKLRQAYNDEAINDERFCCVINSLIPDIAEGEGNKYDGQMDEECIMLCDKLNNLPNLQTFESCCGHLKNRYSIWFFCDNIDTISRLGRCTERNYSDGKWEIIVESTDTHPIGVFWLRSKEPFNTYDEMNDSIKGLIDSISHWFKQEFDSYFQGNAERKDERIRKRLISYFKGFQSNAQATYWEGLNIDKILAWLEKQGKKKSQRIVSAEAKEALFDYENANIQQKDFAQKIEPKFKVGDKIVGIISGIPYYIKRVCYDHYETETGCLIMLCAQDNFELCKQKPAWSEEEEVKINRIVAVLKNLKVADNDILLKDIAWLKSLRPQPKQEWSDEYRNLWEWTFINLSEIKDRFGEDHNKVGECLFWLKTLRPQTTWKPSEEQIDALDEVYKTHGANSACRRVLITLLNDLKKLTE